MRPGSRNLITDVPGLRVGNATDHTLKTGTTVLTAEAPFTAAAHVMGGAPGTRETDILHPDKPLARVDALVLSGGSAFGLDACSGVMDRLRQRGTGVAVHQARVPIVPGAIIFDLYTGQQGGWLHNPYPALGAAAFDAASGDFALGSVGAGTGALTAMLKGGLGSASLTLDSGATVGALVAANPLGSVTTPGDAHFYAAAYEIDGEFGGRGPDPRPGLGRNLESRKRTAFDQQSNTVIAIVATNAQLSKAECHRMAIAAHDGIARACVPSHTPFDGDIVFAASFGKHEADPLEIGHSAALCVTRAIARAVFEASPSPDDRLPTWRGLNT